MNNAAKGVNLTKKVEGGGLEAPRRRGEGEWGGGVPLPSRLESLGERRKLPQRGPGRPKTGFSAF